MKKATLLVLMVAAMLAATATSFADTSVGEGEVCQPEGVQVGTVGETTVSPDTAPPATDVAVGEGSVQVPRYETREGVEEASKRVLRGDFALKGHTHPEYSKKPAQKPAPTRTVYREQVKVVEVEKTPPAAQKPVVINNNFTMPPSESANSSPAKPEERSSGMIAGWVILGLLVAGAIAIAFYAIASSAGVRRQEQLTRQQQAAQLGAALANQAPYLPSPGREVAISATIHPDGGGIVRANARDALQPPQIPAVGVGAPPAPPAVPAVGTPPASPAAPATTAASLVGPPPGPGAPTTTGGGAPPPTIPPATP